MKPKTINSILRPQTAKPASGLFNYCNYIKNKELKMNTFKRVVSVITVVTFIFSLGPLPSAMALRPKNAEGETAKAVGDDIKNAAAPLATGRASGSLGTAPATGEAKAEGQISEAEIQRVVDMCGTDFSLSATAKAAIESYLRGGQLVDSVELLSNEQAQTIVDSESRVIGDRYARIILIAAKLSAQHGFYALGKSGIGSYLEDSEQIEFSAQCIQMDTGVDSRTAYAILAEAKSLYDEAAAAPAWGEALRARANELLNTDPEKDKLGRLIFAVFLAWKSRADGKPDGVVDGWFALLDNLDTSNDQLPVKFSEVMAGKQPYDRFWDDINLNWLKVKLTTAFKEVFTDGFLTNNPKTGPARLAEKDLYFELAAKLFAGAAAAQAQAIGVISVGLKAKIGTILDETSSIAALRNVMELQAMVNLQGAVDRAKTTLGTFREERPETSIKGGYAGNVELLRERLSSLGDSVTWVKNILYPSGSSTIGQGKFTDVISDILDVLRQLPEPTTAPVAGRNVLLLGAAGDLRAFVEEFAFDNSITDIHIEALPEASDEVIKGYDLVVRVVDGKYQLVEFGTVTFESSDIAEVRTQINAWV